jgi:hypothetical protein
MKVPVISRPSHNEYFEYYNGYVSKVDGGDLIKTLRSRRDLVEELYSPISEDQSRFRYAEGKWSIREMVGHLIDTERIMAFRALAFARGDAGQIPGMDQDDYIRNAGFDDCNFGDLVEEFLLARDSHILMFTHFPEAAWNRRGVASGYEFSVRGLGYIVAGHEIHHTNILIERYLAK